MNGFEMILPFLKPIEHLILDDSISEVMVNGPDRVFIEKQGFLQQALYSNPSATVHSVREREYFCGQFRDTSLTYPHAHRPVVAENRWLRFLYRRHRGYLRRAA
jgi:type IV secretory pathway ATPase VirB11/archaellum biosynthesis ATPase